ncbi:MAG TPA: 4-hydroxy-tetrahydrodipicolinate synthase [Candidatus Eremiobacteraceae bacterium]|nr:4-hydroxy-tetrahydrodipicolinate synthase [Candidatus Eremiobacteraceae bacterium]
MQINGIFPALVTPFAADESVSLSAVRENVCRYNATHVAGFVVLGSTGESVMLSREEADSVLAVCKEAAAPQKLLIAGTGAESTAETIARTKRAAALGYPAALVKTPYYYKPVYRAETYIRHYRAVADASPIPILLYSVPQFTGVTLETPEILALAEHPNIVGIKDSSGNVQRVGEIVAGAPSRFQVLTGGAAVIYPSLVVGARGAVLALAAALPEKCAELYDLAQRGERQAAQQLQHLLVRASKCIVSENGIPGVKYAMDLRGFAGGVSRLPLLPLSEEKKRAVADVVAQLHPAAMRV